MKHPLSLRPRAVYDLHKATAWYEERQVGLGDQFLEEVDATLHSIGNDPYQSPEYYRGFRRNLLKRFPYKIFYRIIGNRIVVFRILHGARNHPLLLR